MKLKSIYSYIGYAMIIFFTLYILIMAIAEYDNSVDYTVKGILNLGLLILSGVIVYFFVKIPKDNLSLTSLFSLFGQFTFVFLFSLVSIYYQSPNDKNLAQDFNQITNSEAEVLTRLALCEKAFVTYEDKGTGLVSSIEDTCRKMFVDVVRSSPLNIPPALELISRLENQKKSQRYFANLKVCLTAESGQVDLAVQMADQNKFSHTLKNLKESGHCKIFANRSVANQN